MLILLALTISDAVVLSAAVIVSFHYCGVNTNADKIGLAIRGADAYRCTVCGLGRYTGTAWLKIDGLIQFGRDRRRLKTKKNTNSEMLM